MKWFDGLREAHITFSEPEPPQGGDVWQALVSAGQQFSAEASLEALLQKLVDIARRVIAARYAALAVLGEEGTFEHFVTSGLDEETKAKMGALPTGRGLLGVLLESTGPLRLRELREHPRAVGFPPHHPVMRSFLAVAIVFKGRVLGRLYLTEKIGAEEFFPEDEALAMALAFQAGAAIDGARLNGILASEQERLRALTGQLLRAQEDERRRLAYDIHDGLGQIIVAAGMHMDIYRAERKGKEEPRLEEEFGKAVRYLQEAIVETRRIVSELRPALLDDFGLVEALRYFLEEVAARAGWQAQMVENLGTTRLEPVVETALLRIAQEALANAYRHAQAERVEVRLLKEGQQVLLEVEDWGRGFDSARAAASDGSDRHFGLDSMQERAKLLGADFQCRSAPGQGTTISVSLVLGEEEGISPREEAAVTEEERRDAAAPAAGRGITVLICDDHPMVREGLRSMLNMPGVTLVGEAATGKEAVEEVRRLGPQVVLMDVRMPDMDGLAATEIIKRDVPTTSVIVVTGYESKDYLRRAIAAGAAGYILKGMSRDALINAIKLVKGGGSLIDAKLLGELLREMGVEGARFQEVEGFLEALTPREQEVLQLLVQGLTNKEIAAQMHYSVGTVKNVVQRLIEKLGVSDRTQAAVFAVRRGLASP